MFRNPIQPPVSRRPNAVSKEAQPEPVVPPITSEAVWDGHFPDADADIQASIEYSPRPQRTPSQRYPHRDEVPEYLPTIKKLN